MLDDAIMDCLTGDAAHVGIILKLETRLGFDALPRLLLDAVGTRPLGVMIARGDVALEVGYERLAEVHAAGARGVPPRVSVRRQVHALHTDARVARPRSGVAARRLA